MNKLFKFFLFLSIPLLSVFAVSCSDDDDDPVPATPTITSVSPAQALPGTTVTIAGTNLSNAEVRFGSTAAVASANTANSITTTVPNDAAAGDQNITVTTAAGSTTYAFTVLEATVEPDPTTITSFDPEEGAIGEEITMTGTNFDADNILSIVVGGGDAAYTVVDENTITFTVPDNAENGVVTINFLQGDPVVAETGFTLVSSNQARVYNNVVLRAVGDRFEEGHHTAFNATDGTTHHYTEADADDELSAKMDFIMADSDGAGRYIIISPSHTWLENNYFKGEVTWPVRNETMFEVLEGTYDEAFFEDADYEAIQAMELSGEASDRKDWLEEGNVILFESQSGNKGLIFLRNVDENLEAENPGKKDIFTIDVKVITTGDEE